MPGRITGEGLFRWVRENRPAAMRGLIFVTGDTVSDEAGEFLQRSGRPHIQKPFSIDHYLATLGEAFDARRAA
jgi:hypothetical protein